MTGAPWVTANPSVGIAALKEKALALIRWQPLQWQAMVRSGGPVTRMRTCSTAALAFPWEAPIARHRSLPVSRGGSGDMINLRRACPQHVTDSDYGPGRAGL